MELGTPTERGGGGPQKRAGERILHSLFSLHAVVWVKKMGLVIFGDGSLEHMKAKEKHQFFARPGRGSLIISNKTRMGSVIRY